MSEVPNIQLASGQHYILLQCGLANRLRTLIGFWYIAEKTNRQFIFHWDINDPACNGKWSEIFESLTVSAPTLHLFDTPRSSAVKYLFAGQNTISTIIKKYIPDLVPAGELWGSKYIVDIEKEYYTRLRPKPQITDDVSAFFRINGGKKATDSNIYYNFVAMHIRRTDHVELAKTNDMYTTFEEFDKFVSINTNKNKKIFLATDNIDVQKKYPKCLVYRPISSIASSSMRQTSLSCALIDILIAAQCVQFKGSGYSSYSGLICIYNRIYTAN